MPTFQTGILAEILSGGGLPVTGEPIPAARLAYFRERLKGRLFSFIVAAFKKQQRENPAITQAAIARRLGRRPEQINRWLSGPSNLTADTLSDLILAICGGEPSLDVLPLRSKAQSQTLAERQDTSGSALSREPLAATAFSAAAARILGGQTVRSLDLEAGAAYQSLGAYSEITASGFQADFPAANTNQPLVDQRVIGQP
jgi:hypothetical protein